METPMARQPDTLDSSTICHGNVRLVVEGLTSHRILLGFELASLPNVRFADDFLRYRSGMHPSPRCDIRPQEIQ